MLNPSPTQLAYFAGIFDGEGSIGIYQKLGKYFTARVTVSMCDPDVPKKFHEVFGGSLTHKPALKQHCPTEAWSVSEGNGNQLLHFLELIHPYLITKGPQVWLALHYLKNRKNLTTIQALIGPEQRQDEFAFRKICAETLTAMKQIPKDDVAYQRYLQGGQ